VFGVSKLFVWTRPSWTHWTQRRLVIRHLQTSQARSTRSQPSSSSPALSCWTFSPLPRHFPVLSLHHLCSCLSNMVATSLRVALCYNTNSEICLTQAYFEDCLSLKQVPPKCWELFNKPHSVISGRSESSIKAQAIQYTKFEVIIAVTSCSLVGSDLSWATCLAWRRVLWWISAVKLVLAFTVCRRCPSWRAKQTPGRALRTFSRMSRLI
jgi:hypothetical protein